MKKKSANFLQQFKNFHPALYTTAYWCRDQNFRKYLQTRKNHGIEPSVDYNNFAYKNIEKDYYKSIEEMKKMAESLKN